MNKKVVSGLTDLDLGNQAEQGQTFPEIVSCGNYTDRYMIL